MPRRNTATGLGLAAAALAAIALPRTAGSEGSMTTQDFSLVEQGRYLTTIADCASCHTDPSRPLPFAGGRPIETPFGNVLAPNITPDRETGIGGWTDAAFDAALRRGRDDKGHLLYPAMPFAYYTKMSKQEVLAIRAYLNTLAPVRHKVVANQLPFPFDIRTGMRVWDALYFQEGELRPDPSRPADWNRGAYLVEGPGHCGACHTPKTMLGGDKSDEKLEGYAVQGWFAPDITGNKPHGLGSWSKEDIVAYLKTGHNRFDAATGPMAEEISISSSKMSEADLEAIATYLKDQRDHAEAAQSSAPGKSAMAAGGAIYKDLCSACHKADGTGVPYLMPSLAASPAVASSDPTTILRVLLRGAQSVATASEPTGPTMPAFGWQLSDAQIAAVATYIRNSWGHAAPAVTAGMVRRSRRDLAGRSD